MDKFGGFWSGFDVQNLVGMAVLMWFFMRHIEAKMDRLESKLEFKIDVQSQRTDRLYEMFIDLLKNKS